MFTNDNLTLNVTVESLKGRRDGKFEGWAASRSQIDQSLKEIDVATAEAFMVEYWELLEKFGFQRTGSGGSVDSFATVKGPKFSLTKSQDSVTE